MSLPSIAALSLILPIASDIRSYPSGLLADPRGHDQRRLLNAWIILAKVPVSGKQLRAVPVKKFAGQDVLGSPQPRVLIGLFRIEIPRGIFMFTGMGQSREGEVQLVLVSWPVQ